MVKKFGIILITTLALTLNVYAASDGELILKKNEPYQASPPKKFAAEAIVSLAVLGPRTGKTI